jgi:hypothetical protein
MYHVVVNNWSDRTAYQITSPDGIHDWTFRGVAYAPAQDFARYTNGVVNHWAKLERPGIYLENGHVAAVTLAVIDVEKEQENGNDGHGSKIIVLPFDGQAMDRDLNAAPPAAPAVQTATNSAVKLVLRVVKADSEETSAQDGKAANAVDGDPSTLWHTEWQDNNPPCPHEIVIELVPPAAIKGFTYLPRQDDSENGTIKDYEFYVSDDPAAFSQPVSKGAFENSKALKTVTFPPQKCRYLKLKALSEVNDGAWTSAAEIGVIPAD